MDGMDECKVRLYVSWRHDGHVPARPVMSPPQYRLSLATAAIRGWAGPLAMVASLSLALANIPGCCEKSGKKVTI